MSDLLHIALVLHEDSSYLRGILRGIHAFSLPRKNWLFRLFAPEVAGIVTLQSWHPDAIVANIHDRELEVALCDLQRPLINLANILEAPQVPWVGVDDHALAQEAAQHLCRCGLRHFAYCGFAQWRFSLLRRDGFAAIVQAAGSYLELLLPPPSGDAQFEHQDWQRVDQRLHDWLCKLPQPIGIFACNDYMALELLNACRIAGIVVPEQIAIIGADNDDLICEMSIPPLSSVGLPLESIGFTAATLLAQQMATGTLPPQETTLPPAAITARQSSMMLAFEDPLLQQALRFIHDQRGQNIRVEDLIRRIPLSRRSLERRFTQTLGRTPLQEIRRVHLEEAKRLLGQTELTLAEIAPLAGFSDAKQLCLIFQQALAMTPKMYRRQFQATASQYR